MNKAYEYRIYPTAGQVSLFNKTLGLCRLYYNLVVENKNKNHNLPIESYLTTFTKYKPEALDWIKEVDSNPISQIWKDVRGAYTNYFKSLNGERKGKPVQLPVFKSKKNNKVSFRYSCTAVSQKITSKGLYVSRKIGYVPIHASSQFCRGTWNNITFKRSASGKWYAKICVETKDIKKIQNGKAIGIDWNCNSESFLTLSDGTKIKCPQFLLRKEKQLVKYQQALSRKYVKGKDVQSKRYQKVRLKVARLHEKVANQRRDWLHKVSRDLANKYQYVIVEDINLQKMASELEHGKIIYDQGFGRLRRYIAYKTNLVKVSPKNTTKTCNVCGNVNMQVVLGVKNWVCPVCNTSHDRDVNAAKNILYLGVKRTVGREPTEVLNNARGSDEARKPETTMENHSVQVRESHASLACGEFNIKSAYLSNREVPLSTISTNKKNPNNKKIISRYEKIHSCLTAGTTELSSADYQFYIRYCRKYGITPNKISIIGKTTCSTRSVTQKKRYDDIMHRLGIGEEIEAIDYRFLKRYCKRNKLTIPNMEVTVLARLKQ